MSTNTTCPDPSTLPEFNNISGLPTNVSIGFVPIGRNGSREAMSSCCAPQPVNTASDCYYWCEQPTEGALDGFVSCLSRRGMERGIVGLHESSSAADRKASRGLAGVMLSALLVTIVLRS